jgi:hypothetical protein
MNKHGDFGVVVARRFQAINGGVIRDGAVMVPGNSKESSVTYKKILLKLEGKDEKDLIELISAKEWARLIRKGKAEVDNGTPMIEVEDIDWETVKQVNKKKDKTGKAYNREADGCAYEKTMPGSAERIAALREHYATKGENSPFIWTYNEIAGELITKFANGDYDNDSGKHMHKTMQGICAELRAEMTAAE